MTTIWADWECPRCVVEILEETRIVLVYSLGLAILTLALGFIGLDHVVFVSLVQILVFFAVAYHEDKATVNLSWTYLLARFMTNFCLTLLCKKTILLIDPDPDLDFDLKGPSTVLLAVFYEYVASAQLLSISRMYILAMILIILITPVCIQVVELLIDLALTARNMNQVV